jgi:hypothetical protein
MSEPGQRTINTDVHSERIINTEPYRRGAARCSFGGPKARQ